MSNTAAAVDWKSRAGTLKFQNQAFIGGRYVEAASGERLACISPINGAKLADVASCATPDVDAAVTAARKAFEAGSWARLDRRERKRILLRFADLIETHREELALTETLDMGMPIGLSVGLSLAQVPEVVRWHAEAIDKIYDEIAPSSNSMRSFITREPLGVVGCIVPWNVPLWMASWKFAPALAVGNSVVLKPAEQAPLSALRVAELASIAGIPEGVFNVVPGVGEIAGRALALHMDVDAIAFTGSTEVGKLILQYAGQSNLKQVSLECGGKAANIVMADAPDLDAAAFAAAFTGYGNSGQVCVAGARLLIEQSIYDTFLEKVQACAAGMQPNDPLEPATMMGSMVDRAQMERVLHYVEIGRAEGAKLAWGGKRVREETHGFYIEPALFDGVHTRMRIAREEIFGPVIAAMPFKEMSEAIAIANDTQYGLGSYVWTGSLEKAHTMAGALRTGTVNINNIEGGDITVPFGGFKQSGFGRDKSLHSFDKYSQLKSTCIKLR